MIRIPTFLALPGALFFRLGVLAWLSNATLRFMRKKIKLDKFQLSHNPRKLLLWLWLSLVLLLLLLLLLLLVRAPITSSICVFRDRYRWCRRCCFSACFFISCVVVVVVVVVVLFVLFRTSVNSSVCIHIYI